MTTQAIAPRPTQAVATIDIAKKFLFDATVQSEITKGLAKNMTAERMCRLALTAAQKNQKLLECFATPSGKRSIALAMLTAGQLGLEPDGRHAHLVPFKNNRGGYMEVVFMADYKGLIKLAYNHPKVRSIWSEEVRGNDHFVFQRGSNPMIEHIIDVKTLRGELIAAYACCELEGSRTPVFVVMTAEDIDRIKASSRGADQPDSPWNTAPGEMWKKSAIRALSKVIPQSAELMKALAVEDDFEDTGKVGNSLTIDVQSEPEVRFRKEIKQTEDLPEQRPEPETTESSAAPEQSEAAIPATEEQPKESTKRTRKAEPAPTTPSTEQPASQQNAVVEENLAAKIDGFYRANARGATAEHVIGYMKQMKPTVWGEVAEMDYAKLPEKLQNELWGSRHGVSRAVKAKMPA